MDIQNKGKGKGEIRMEELKQFDLVFFIDEKSFTEGSVAFLNELDYSKTKVRIFTPVALRLNELASSGEANEKEKAREAIKLVAELVKEKKISYLGKPDEQYIDYHLLETLLKSYYSKNVLIVVNDESRARIYLPLSPVFYAWGKAFAVVSNKEEMTKYQFDAFESVIALLPKSESTEENTSTEAPIADKKAEQAKEEEAKPTEAPAPVEAPKSAEEPEKTPAPVEAPNPAEEPEKTPAPVEAPKPAEEPEKTPAPTEASKPTPKEEKPTQEMTDLLKEFDF